MAKDSVKAPVKVNLLDVSSVNLMFSPNYGEIVGFEFFAGGHEYDIYYNNDGRSINFYKDKTLAWSK